VYTTKPAPSAMYMNIHGAQRSRNFQAASPATPSPTTADITMYPISPML
jgi:hypothetical protein